MYLYDYVTMYLYDYVPVWLCDHVPIWLCTYEAVGNAPMWQDDFVLRGYGTTHYATAWPADCVDARQL